MIDFITRKYRRGIERVKDCTFIKSLTLIGKIDLWAKLTFLAPPRPLWSDIEERNLKRLSGYSAFQKRRILRRLKEDFERSADEWNEKWLPQLSFQDLLNDYLTPELLRDEFEKRSYILSMMEKDSGWTHGTLPIPFEQ